MIHLHEKLACHHRLVQKWQRRSLFCFEIDNCQRKWIISLIASHSPGIDEAFTNLDRKKQIEDQYSEHTGIFESLTWIPELHFGVALGADLYFRWIRNAQFWWETVAGTPLGSRLTSFMLEGEETSWLTTPVLTVNRIEKEGKVCKGKIEPWLSEERRGVGKNRVFKWIWEGVIDWSKKEKGGQGGKQKKEKRAGKKGR